jgi:hypothetical protein
MAHGLLDQYRALALGEPRRDLLVPEAVLVQIRKETGPLASAWPQAHVLRMLPGP